MLRSKRQRTGDLGATDDEMARLNPSLMTERQQLAFLLRKTAPASDSEQSSDSSEDELIQTFARGTRRIPRPVVSSSPRRSAVTQTGGRPSVGSGGDSSDFGGDNDGVTRSRSRGRFSRAGDGGGGGRTPRGEAQGSTAQARDVRTRVLMMERDGSRRSDQPPRGGRETVPSDASLEDEEEVRPPPSKKLNVLTAARAAKERRSRAAAAHRVKKHSPSSSSDVLHMEPFESDFWRLHCALCCATNGSKSEHGAASEALFLCPSCDRKYPTQRALGRV